MRAEKVSITDDLTQRLEGAGYVILADFKGLTVEKTQDLRGKLREADARMLVVKNRLLARAARAADLAALAERLEPGPTAIFYGPGDGVAASKVLKTFSKQTDQPSVKYGALSGKVISREDIDCLAALPSQLELRAQVLGTVAAPLTQFVRVLHQSLAGLVYALKAVQEQKEQGE